jgi:hypothetical protein
MCTCVADLSVYVAVYMCEWCREMAGSAFGVHILFHIVQGIVLI